MVHFANILHETPIGKIEFSKVSSCVYDAFWSEKDNNSDIDFVEMQLWLSLLEEQSKVITYLLYHNKLHSIQEESQAITFLSKVEHLKEAFDLAQGITTIEEIEAAAKTLAPKMQSAFGKE